MAVFVFKIAKNMEEGMMTSLYRKRVCAYDGDLQNGCHLTAF